MGLSKFASPSEASSVHSQQPLVSRHRTAVFGLGMPAPRHVPSLPFLPASTVFSTRTSQVYCTLHPIMRFATFQALACPPLGRTRSPLASLPKKDRHRLHAVPRVRPACPEEPAFTTLRTFSRRASPLPFARAAITRRQPLHLLRELLRPWIPA